MAAQDECEDLKKQLQESQAALSQAQVELSSASSGEERHIMLIRTLQGELAQAQVHCHCACIHALTVLYTARKP